MKRVIRGMAAVTVLTCGPAAYAVPLSGPAGAHTRPSVSYEVRYHELLRAIVLGQTVGIDGRTYVARAVR